MLELDGNDEVTVIALGHKGQEAVKKVAPLSVSFRDVRNTQITASLCRNTRIYMHTRNLHGHPQLLIQSD